MEDKKGKECRVTFKDATAKDKAKETLYMFFTRPGNFVAANFTGQQSFADLIAWSVDPWWSAMMVPRLSYFFARR